MQDKNEVVFVNIKNKDGLFPKIQKNIIYEVLGVVI